MSIIPSFEGASTFSDIQTRFIDSALSLMLKYDLRYEPFLAPLQITQLELYLYSNSWRDPNTDKDEEQKESGTWYVHNRGTNANRSRLDITCGSKNKNIFGGLLVRGVNGVDGSGKAIKQIVRGKSQTALSWLQDELDNLKTNIAGTSVFDSILKLERREHSRIADYHLETRKGLRYSESPWDWHLHISVPAT